MGARARDLLGDPRAFRARKYRYSHPANTRRLNMLVTRTTLHREGGWGGE